MAARDLNRHKRNKDFADLWNNLPFTNPYKAALATVPDLAVELGVTEDVATRILVAFGRVAAKRLLKGRIVGIPGVALFYTHMEMRHKGVWLAKTAEEIRNGVEETVDTESLIPRCKFSKPFSRMLHQMGIFGASVKEQLAQYARVRELFTGQKHANKHSEDRQAFLYGVGLREPTQKELKKIKEKEKFNVAAQRNPEAAGPFASGGSKLPGDIRGRRIIKAGESIRQAINERLAGGLDTSPSESVSERAKELETIERALDNYLIRGTYKDIIGSPQTVGDAPVADAQAWARSFKRIWKAPVPWDIPEIQEVVAKDREEYLKDPDYEAYKRFVERRKERRRSIKKVIKAEMARPREPKDEYFPNA